VNTYTLTDRELDAYTATRQEMHRHLNANVDLAPYLTPFAQGHSPMNRPVTADYVQCPDIVLNYVSALEKRGHELQDLVKSLEEEVRIADGMIERQKEMLKRSLEKIRRQHQQLVSLTEHNKTGTMALVQAQNAGLH
jgi:hypothetical protein